MSELSRLFRFACVGASVAVIYITLYLAFLALGWAQIGANGVAFLLAVAVQYIAQAGFTFRAKLGDSAQMLRFGVMITCGLITSALITGWLAPLAQIPAALAAALVTLILPLQNYLIMSRWVFPSARKPLDFST